MKDAVTIVDLDCDQCQKVGVPHQLIMGAKYDYPVAVEKQCLQCGHRITLAKKDK